MTRRGLRAFIVGLSLLFSGVDPAASQDRAGREPLRIYLARHGETPSNAERRVLGQLDQPLNARGLEQAEALRDALRGVSFSAIYASPLSRSLTTAAIIADGRPVRILSDLRERNQGRFQGLLADTQPDFAKRMTDPRDGLDGGETTLQLGTRARSALRVIQRGHRTGSILIVGHFLINQMVLRELLGLSTEAAMTITQANDELYMIETTRGRAARVWKLIGRSMLGEL